MRLALHRSILFWSGLFIMASITWAWWDSYRNLTALQGGELWTASHWGGWDFYKSPSRGSAFEFTRERLGRTAVEEVTFPPPGFLRSSDFSEAEKAAIKDSGDFTLPEFLDFRMSLDPRGAWTLFLPYWLLLLAFALLWLGLLVWRARRRKRRMTNAELPNDE